MGEQLAASKEMVEDLETRLKDQRNDILKRAEEEAISKNDELEMAAVRTYKDQLALVSKESEERETKAEKLREDLEESTRKWQAAEAEEARLKVDWKSLSN